MTDLLQTAPNCLSRKRLTSVWTFVGLIASTSAPWKLAEPAKDHSVVTAIRHSGYQPSCRVNTPGKPWWRPLGYLSFYQPTGAELSSRSATRHGHGGQQRYGHTSAMISGIRMKVPRSQRIWTRTTNNQPNDEMLSVTLITGLGFLGRPTYVSSRSCLRFCCCPF